MNNKVFIFVIPILLLVVVGLTLTLDYSNNGEHFQLPTSSTRTDQVPSQVLENGCFPALHLNGTYYEVCYDRDV